MKSYIIEMAVPFFFLLILIEAVVSRIYRKKLYSFQGSINDLSLALFQSVLGVLPNLLALTLYLLVFENLRVQHFLTVPEVPSGNPFSPLDGITLFWWVTVFVLVDLCYYWFHRMAHEMNIIWASHVVHHSSEEYNLVVALRQGGFQMLFNGLFFLPLAVLGVPADMMIICYSINLIYQFLIHTRAVNKLGFLELFMNTPSHHRVHHGRNPRYCDKNHAGVFIIWDRLFGTFQEEDEEPIYGITVPLRSYNPIWGNLHYFLDVFKDVWRARRWSDKFRLLFKPPGWKPAELGAPVLPKEIDRATYRPFRLAVPYVIIAYCFLQFGPALLAGKYVQNAWQEHSEPLYKIIAISFFALLTMTNIGGALERRLWAYYSEVARLLTLTFVGVFSILFDAYKWYYAVGFIAIGVISLLWLVLVRKEFNREKWIAFDPSAEKIPAEPELQKGLEV